MTPTPRFFVSAAAFRKWLHTHHATETELCVGFHKAATGKPCMTWPESVDEALCVGWIDGIRRRIDDESYQIRFTPRKPTSIWSTVNLRRMQELIRAGRVLPAGLAVFEKRSAKKTASYSFEQKVPADLDAASLKRFRANLAAWTYFDAQPPSYRQKVLWWVISGKKDETRQKRLTLLIDASANGKRL